MKFYHTSDIHLGAVPDGCFPWSKARGEEIYDSFVRLVDQANLEKNAGKDGNTRAAIKAMENPYVNILGHPDDSRFPLDYEARKPRLSPGGQQLPDLPFSGKCAFPRWDSE